MNEKHQVSTANERTNREVIRGLLLISLLLWVGIIVLHFWHISVDNAIVLAASNIPAGLLGYISRDPKHVPGATVDAGPAGNVTVNTAEETVHTDAEEPPNAG